MALRLLMLWHFGAATKRIGDTIESTKLDLKNRLAADNSLLNQNKSWLEEYRQHPSDENLSLNFRSTTLVEEFSINQVK